MEDEEWEGGTVGREGGMEVWVGGKIEGGEEGMKGGGGGGGEREREKQGEGERKGSRDGGESMSWCYTCR